MASETTMVSKFLIIASRAEDSQQIILEREVETALAGVPLATCTAAELIVDAPRLVPLGDRKSVV